MNAENMRYIVGALKCDVRREQNTSPNMKLLGKTRVFPSDTTMSSKNSSITMSEPAHSTHKTLNKSKLQIGKTITVS